MKAAKFVHAGVGVVHRKGIDLVHSYVVPMLLDLRCVAGPYFILFRCLGLYLKTVLRRVDVGSGRLGAVR